MRGYSKGMLKTLSHAHKWGSVDRGSAPSSISLVRAIDAGLLSPIQIPRWSEDQQRQLRELGYDEEYGVEYLLRTKTAYKLTEKGLKVVSP